MIMKKIFILLPVFMAAVLVAGCSMKTELGSGSNGETAMNYLSVNLVTAPGTGTRAYGDDDFEDGNSDENTVQSVRFYFFDEAGNAASVKKNGDTYQNWYDWIPESASNGEKPNVEKILDATLIIETPNEDKLPAYVVAVINPVKDMGTYDSLDDMRVDARTDLDVTDKNFVMSNSVYALSDGSTTMDAVSVEGKLYNTREAALANPVTIYVERVLAKVSLTTDIQGKTLANGTVIYPAGTSENPQQYDGKDIYVKFLGWNVTATADKSYLVKKINPSWRSNLFGSDDQPWNYYLYFRSFWAINPDGLNYGYTIFNESNGNGDTSLPLADELGFTTNGDKPNYTYVRENAAKDTYGANTETPTKVIIAAQLVDENGSPIELAEYAGVKYTIDGLKTIIANSASLYKRETEASTYTKIEAKDIEFKTATDVNLAGETGRYYVYAQLTEAAENYTSWVNSEYSESHGGIDANVANEALIALGHAKIWKEGYTYYYFDIRHLGEVEGEPGYVGVVRNHLYNSRLTSLVGLGTPVYDPGETIYPEKPEEDDTYIAAEIKILSWRVVSNDIELEW